MAAAESAEEFALRHILDSTARILDNVGFTSTSAESLHTLTDVMRRYLERICYRGKEFAAHGGRTTFDVEDMILTFRRMNINGVELHEYLHQVGNIHDVTVGPSSSLQSSSLGARANGQPLVLPKLPVEKPGMKLLFMAPPAEREIKDRREKYPYIPEHFPTLNPDWNGNKPFVMSVKPSTSTADVVDGTGTGTPEKKSTKPLDELPNFMNMDALSLGIVKRAPPPVVAPSRIDHSSATGITSSANTASGTAAPPKRKSLHRSLLSGGNRSERSSPVPPAHSPKPSSLQKRVESTPNLEGLVPKVTISFGSLKKEALEKAAASPLVASTSSAKRTASPAPLSKRNNHVYDDIPVLDDMACSIDNAGDSNLSRPCLEDASAATPEYRMNNVRDKEDSSSQPPTLISVKAEKKKQKKYKEKRKGGREKDNKDDRPLSAIPPLLERAYSESPSRVETPPMRFANYDEMNVVSTSSALSPTRIRITLRDPTSLNSPAVSPDSNGVPRTPSIGATMSPVVEESIPGPARLTAILGTKDGSNDSNTIPLVDGVPCDEDLSQKEKKQTTFPLDMSLDSEGHYDKEKDEEDKSKRKKNKKKDKGEERERRDSSTERHRERKRDKEHKKKKKKGKSRERNHSKERSRDKHHHHHKHSKQEKSEKKSEENKTGAHDPSRPSSSLLKVEEPSEEIKLPTLKIKLCSPTSSESSATPFAAVSPIEKSEPVKIKLKGLSSLQAENNKREASPQPAIKMSFNLLKKEAIIKEEKPPMKEKNKERPFKTAAELKAFPPHFTEPGGRVKTKAELKAPPDYPPLFSVDTAVVREKDNKERVKTKAELKAPPDYPPLFSVDTKIVRTGTPNKDREKDKLRKSNTSTPIPAALLSKPNSARNSPVPPVTPLIATIKADKNKSKKEKERTKDVERDKAKESEKKKSEKLEKLVLIPSSKPSNNEKRKSISKIELQKKPSSIKKKKSLKSAEFVIEEPVADADAEEGDDKEWICPVCSIPYDPDANMVGCDMCDDWYHWSCVGLVVAPPDDQPWFCDTCIQKKIGEKRKSTSAGGNSAKKKKKT